jgi:hypothetical protein
MDSDGNSAYKPIKRRAPYGNSFQRGDIKKFDTDGSSLKQSAAMKDLNGKTIKPVEEGFSEVEGSNLLSTRSWTIQKVKQEREMRKQATEAVGKNEELTNIEAAELYSSVSVKLRNFLYRSGNMMEYLKTDNCIKDMVNKYEEVNTLSCVFVTPSSKTFSTSKEDNLKMKAVTGEDRTVIEGLMAQKDAQRWQVPIIASAIDVQGYFSIGKWEPLNQTQIDDYKASKGVCKQIYEDGNENFNEWEKMNCWLCGLPLSFNDDPKQADSFPQQPISCEHKNPVGVMMLQGAGVQTAIPTDTMQRVASNVNSAIKQGINIARRTDKEIDPAWKEMVRAEGYGWSHHWCNMKKNQAPFFTVRDYNVADESSDKEETHVTYQMEVNNIYHFVKDLFNLDDDFLDGTGVDFEPGDKPYNFNKTDKSGTINQNPIRLWCDEMNLSKDECDEFKKKQAYNAFSNIIKMLIPTYYLLNCGSDVSETTKKERDNLFGKRSMFKGIDLLTVRDKFTDNYMRILGYLSKRDKDRMLGKIEATLGKHANSGTVPRLISILFQDVAVKPGCIQGKETEMEELSNSKQEIEDEFFNALQSVQRLQYNPPVDNAENATFTRMNSLTPSFVATLGKPIIEEVNRIRLPYIKEEVEVEEEEEEEEEEDEDDKAVEPDASLSLSQDASLSLSQGVLSELSQTQPLDSQYGGRKRKKTRRKRRKIKKKTRKRIYFKDLLDDHVQSGGLLPRRIYFNDLL